jgi:hypothetical protein
VEEERAQDRPANAGAQEGFARLLPFRGRGDAVVDLAALQQGDSLPVTNDPDHELPQPGMATVTQRVAVAPGFEELRLIAHRAEFSPARKGIQGATERLGARLAIEDDDALSVHGDQGRIDSEVAPDQVKEAAQSGKRDQFVKSVHRVRHRIHTERGRGGQAP